MNKSKLITGSVAGVFMLLVALSSWYTVDETERGVLLRNGAFVEIVEPGLHFKIPLFESVKLISVQSFSHQWKNLPAYSKDQQTAQISISVSWRVLPADVAAVYMQYKDVDGVLTRLIGRNVPTQVENVFGQYTAVSAIQDRAKFGKDLQDAIKSAVVGPVVVDSIQIENIDFNDDYEKAISDRMKAEVEVKTREQQLKTEQVQAQINVTKAQATADSNLALAKSQALSIKLTGEAEAHAIKVKAQALASNASLVELTKAEKWNGVLPVTMLPNSTVPFIEANK